MQVKPLIPVRKKLPYFEKQELDPPLGPPLYKSVDTINWETIRNIAAFRAVLFVIMSLLVTFLNYRMYSISSSTSYALLGISISLLFILTILFNCLTNKLENNCFLRFLFLIFYSASIVLLLLSIEYSKTTSGRLFFFLFVAIACSSLGLSDVLTIAYVTIRKQNIFSSKGNNGVIEGILTIFLCGAQFILTLIFTGNWWSLLFYLIVFVISIFLVIFTNLVNKSGREVYNYLIYGVTRSFSHFFGAIFYIPIIIFSIPLFIILVIPMKICSCELGYDDFRKKLLGNYHFTEI